MSVLLYPLRCFFPWKLQRIQHQIFQWLLEEVHVHFIRQDHNICCDQFTTTKLGHDPERKIVLITPDMNVEVDALVTAFNRGHTELAGNGILPGDRTCPFCGLV